MLPYSRQQIGYEEATAVAAAVRDAYVTGGPTLARFESALAEAVGARHAIAVSSGTAALHVAYRAAGVGPGDTVLTSPLSFVATANAAVYCGALPRFVDTDERAHLDPVAVRLAIARGPTPRVVVPVHYAGHPAPIEDIAGAAAGAIVIEDACHALGALYRDGAGVWQPVGSCAHSAMAVFSFHPVKSITTGEGGAILTNDALLAGRCRRLRDHGLVRAPAELQAFDDPWAYEMHEVGFNYRLTDVQAALGLVQIGRLPGFIRRRQEIAGRYDRGFEQIGVVRPVSPPRATRSAWHLHPVRVPATIRRPMFEALRARGIGVQVHYIPIHLQPYYRRLLSTAPGDFPVAEAFYAEELSLPCFPAMDDGDVERVIATVSELIGGTRVPEAVHADPAW